ncbi:MAG: hypothetical protein RMH84_02000 [Sulfolobales archaeon]|nr:hypothetical protein [Sulfolobales archaeon]MDW8010350.1 hypothetical protein [Sulfolobales archaeon]
MCPTRWEVDPELVRKLWFEGKGCKGIAEELGIPDYVVKYYIRKMGLKRERSGRIDPELLKKLWFECGSVVEIARVMGFSIDSVRAAARRLGLPSRSEIRKKLMRRSDICMKEAYEYVQRHGVVLGKPPSGISRYLEKLVDEGKVKKVTLYAQKRTGEVWKKYGIRKFFRKRTVYWVDDGALVLALVNEILDKLPLHMDSEDRAAVLRSITYMMKNGKLPQNIKDRVLKAIRVAL